LDNLRYIAYFRRREDDLDKAGLVENSDRLVEMLQEKTTVKSLSKPARKKEATLHLNLTTQSFVTSPHSTPYDAGKRVPFRNLHVKELK
jgi:hypothetical protein